MRSSGTLAVLYIIVRAECGLDTRWTESIAQKVKRKKKVEDNSRKEIWRSVFEPQYVPSVTYNDPVSVCVCFAMAWKCNPVYALRSGQDFGS